MKLSNKIFIILSAVLMLSIVFFIYGIQSSSVIPAKTGIQPLPVIPSETRNLSSDTSTEVGTQDQTTSSSTSSQNCDVKQVTDTVHGGSMSGIVENGQQITIFEGYYKCHIVQRNDLVIYNYAGNSEPLIKIVRAIPGDKWQLKLADQGYKIIVNGKILTTSGGEPYQIPTANIAMLKLYTSSYPTIPKDTYLILGNLPSGTLDSSRFGLIGLQDIIGKAVIQD